MAAKARFEENKEYIIEKLNVKSLFEYFVDHGYMETSLKDKIVRHPPVEVNKNMYLLLSRYVNDSDDVIDNLFFRGLIATGQSDIVLKIFPDFNEKTINTYRFRIILNRKYLEKIADIPCLKKYITDNKMLVPEYETPYQPLRTHSMKTRSVKTGKYKPLWSFLVVRVMNDRFDCNTDPLVQALVKSGQIRLVKTVFPYMLTKIHCW